VRDEWKDLEAYRRALDRQQALRTKFGVPCAECMRRARKGGPKMLLPGGYCYHCRYRDPRPPLTDAQMQEALC
jgi:hypothetical protein